MENNELNVEDARKIIGARTSPIVQVCHATAFLISSGDATFEDLVLALNVRGVPAEMAALELYKRTNRKRGPSLLEVVLDPADWRKYLVGNGFVDR